MKKSVCGLLITLVCVMWTGDVLAACPTNPPVLESPGNGATVPFGNVLLNWSNVANALTYDLYAGLDGDTPSLIEDNIAISQKSLNLEPGRNVQWKVVANAPSCTAQISSYSFFTTSCPTIVPVLREPDAGQRFDVGEAITFEWFGVPGAAGYDVQVTPDFGQTFQTIAENLVALSFTTDDLPEGDWGWTVRANFDGSCPPAYAQPSHFLVTDCSVEPPVLLSPPAGATDLTNPVTLQWSAVQGAKEYRVLASIDGSIPQLLDTTTDTKTTKTFEGSEVFWAVQAIFPGDCPAATSDQRRFTMLNDGTCPSSPGKALLVSPAAGAENLTSPVTFDWDPVPGATSYRVVIINEQNELQTFPTTDSKLTTKLAAGAGQWLVQTLFGERCPATSSERRAFTVSQGASCSGTKPQLIAPGNQSIDPSNPKVFKWNAVADATAYTLFVSTSAQGEDFAAYGRAEAGTTQLERVVPKGLVRWFIAAHFAACPDVRSDIWSFSSGDECPNRILTLTSPAADASVNSPVTLAWSLSPATAGAEYRLTIESASGTTLLSQRTESTTATLRLPSGAFLWRVETVGSCPVSSERRKFTVVAGTDCSTLSGPVLLSPVGPSTQPALVESPVTLRWNPAGSALGYRLFLAREDQPFEDSTVTDQTSRELDLEPGRYRWFVRAIFEGCPSDGASSDTAHFVIARKGCETAPPELIAPAPAASVASPVTFTWGAVAGAKKYRVHILTGGKLQVLGTTPETELTSVLPPGQYSFTVEADFESCPSTRAGLRQFSVAQSQNCPTEAAQPLSPPNEAMLSEQEVDFIWTPVSGAIRYAVVARLGDGAETVLGATEDVHLVHTVPQGKISWRVIAFFSGCDSVRSESFTFSVARRSDCTDRKPVLLFPRNDDRVPSPVEFTFLQVPGAVSHRVWVQKGDERPNIVSTQSGERVELSPGTWRWFVEAQFENCPSAFSARSEFIATAAVPCGTPAKPEAQVLGQVLSGTPYRVRWSPLANVARYELQESTSPDFANPLTTVVDGLSNTLVHQVSGDPVKYFYRVRGLSECNDSAGPYSGIVSTVVVNAAAANASVELGESSVVVQTVFLPGQQTPVQFNATVDQPWMTVTPSSGTLPVTGLTLTITADPADLGIGTNNASLRVTYGGAAAGGIGLTGNTSTTVPLAVSLVTPVTPGGQGTPPPDSLIFAAVGHAAGANGSFFQSDIRITNLTAQTMAYELNFTPSGANGTEAGISTTVEVAPNATLAMDDIVAVLFGSGIDGSSLGMLEVRPVTPASTSGGGLFGDISDSALRQLDTAASSRTFNFTPNGTFGQFIPATLYRDFVGRNEGVLSLQQVSQSAKFRANFGFLEASGNPVSLVMRVYNTANALLATIPVSLQARQHRQLYGLLQQNGITSLEDGRVEVEVVGGEGKVTAYVSEVDNATNDPLLVTPVVKGAIQSDRYIVPGLSFTDTGAAFWVSDLWIFNAGAAATPAVLTFVPEGNPAGALTRELVIDAGEIEVLDNVIGGLFGQPNGTGGSIIITTPAATSLTATARTYNETDTGSYGQYIPGITPADAAGAGDRALQILQVEQSSRLRTNIGLAETTGSPATVEVSLITPDSLATATVTLELAANEFRQFSVADFQPSGAVYNGRVTVKVIGGGGRVTAYGSAIDEITQDPTYVPAQ